MLYRLRRFWGSLNKIALGCALLLLAVGWALVLSATLPGGQETVFPLPADAAKQALWVALGLVALFVMATVDYHVLLRLSPWIYGGALFLLALVLGIGHTSAGARRWFNLGKVYLQPGEFTKLGVLLMAVRLAAGAPSTAATERRAGWGRWLLSSVVAVGIPWALIAGQPNLGTAMLLVVCAVAVWIVVGVPWTYFAGAAGSAAAIVPFGWAFFKDYQKARLLNFLNPYRDPLGGGYTVIQSTMAIGSGGLFGRGYMHGPQNRLNFIPKHHTDFIVSVVGEEFGWFGCLALLAVYAFLYMEGLRIAHRARDHAGTHLAVGIVALLAAQTLVNLGLSMGVVPITGLPRPLLSYGGASLLINAGLLGIVLNIGRQHRR